MTVDLDFSFSVNEAQPVKYNSRASDSHKPVLFNKLVNDSEINLILLAELVGAISDFYHLNCRPLLLNQNEPNTASVLNPA